MSRKPNINPGGLVVPMNSNQQYQQQQQQQQQHQQNNNINNNNNNNHYRSRNYNHNNNQHQHQRQPHPLPSIPKKSHSFNNNNNHNISGTVSPVPPSSPLPMSSSMLMRSTSSITTTSTSTTPSTSTPSHSPSPIPSSDPSETVDKLARSVPDLPEPERTNVQNTLNLLPNYPPEFPLTYQWNLFFSDTSTTPAASKRSSLNQAAQYSSNLQPIITCCKTVPELCGALKTIRKARNSFTNNIPNDNDNDNNPTVGGLGVSKLRLNQNLHFFRHGVSPVWEDPWNAKGGRFTLTPPSEKLDEVFLSLIFLLAGSAIEIDISSKVSPDSECGQILGVVVSRRTRGDRIELWLGGSSAGLKPDPSWLDALSNALSAELNGLEVGKYKPHF